MTEPSVSQRLHEELGQIIAQTDPGDRLLSEPKLARKLGVSRATLREVMRTFETQGLIHRRQGSGTFVSHPTQIIESGLEVLESIETLAARVGLPVRIEDWKVERRQAAPDECRALGIEPCAEVLYVSRVILAEERPVAYLIDVLPVGVLPVELLEKTTSGSVLDRFLEHGSPRLSTSRTEINAVNASPEIARHMGIQRGDVLLRFLGYLYAVDGRVVDFSFSYFLPGYFRFHLVRRVGEK